MNDSLEPTQGESTAPEYLPPSVEPPLKPVARDAGDELRIVDVTWFQFRARRRFERRLDLTGFVNSRSRVFVSISEIGVFGGQWKPFQGAATMQVYNVVPHDDGIVIVRGFIDWDGELNVRLSVLVA